MKASELLNTDVDKLDIDIDFYLDKLEAEESLYSFLCQAWHIIEPNTEFSSNWTIKTVCDHLEAVTRGDIRNLVINIPPRTSKSIITNVMWPAWIWTRHAHEQFIFSAYAESLAIRDSVKCRLIIESDWYQKRWGDKVQLAGDQNTKKEFKTTNMGHRVITTACGSGIGLGANYVVCDDGNDPRHARSKTKLEAVQFWWDNVMATRLNNAKTGSKVIIQQRISENDLSGHVLKKGGWTHLYIQMEYEEKKRCETSFFTDPRNVDGELAWPERFGDDEIKTYKKDLGASSYAGQYQQSPAPAKGALVKRNWIKFYKETPSFNYIAISGDFSFKGEATNDPIALSVWGIIDTDRYLLHMVNKKCDFPETIQELLAVDRMYPNARFILIEDKANGPAIVSTLKQKIGKIVTYSPRESKEERLASIAPQIEAGHLFVPDPYYSKNREKPWVKLGVDSYIEELVTFPNATHDDCLTFDTLVLTKHGAKKIGNIFVGDIVLSWDGCSIIECVVTRSWCTGVKHIVKVTLGDEVFYMSESHPLLTTRGWVSAWELTNTDFIVRIPQSCGVDISGLEKITDTSRVPSVLTVKDGGCTKLYTLLLMAQRVLLGWLYTTLIMIKTTIGRVIYWPLLLASTLKTITALERINIQRKNTRESLNLRVWLSRVYILVKGGASILDQTYFALIVESYLNHTRKVGMTLNIVASIANNNSTTRFVENTQKKKLNQVQLAHSVVVNLSLIILLMVLLRNFVTQSAGSVIDIYAVLSLLTARYAVVLFQLINVISTVLKGVIRVPLKTGRVSSAQLYSKHRIMAKKYTAAQNVIKDTISVKINKNPYSNINDVDLIQVSSVRHAGKEKTYNLDVENSHNFLIGSGFVTHNCVDSTTQLFIRVGNKKSMADVIEGMSGLTETNDATQELASLMGWDLSGNQESNLPFNIDF